MRTKVYFRADGNSEIGLGHVIRSCAVAEMLRSEFACSFFIRKPSDYLRQQITIAGCTLVELSEFSTYEKEAEGWAGLLDGSEIIVLDGYNFATKYQQILKQKSNKLVCIDDMHAYHFVSDIVINHGLTNASLYSKDENTILLLGPKYCLVRKAFSGSSKNEKRFQMNTAFICFGGADKLNLTTIYLRRIMQSGFVEKVHVVVGGAFQHLDALLIEQKRWSSDRVFINKNLSAEKLAHLILESDIAVVPGSTIAIECACVGIGLISGYYVDNQRDINRMLLEEEMAFSINDFTKARDRDFNNALEKFLSHEFYEHMLQKQGTAFDGQSADRLLKIFQKLANAIIA